MWPRRYAKPAGSATLAAQGRDAIEPNPKQRLVRVPVPRVAAGQDRIVSTSAIEILAGRLEIGAQVSLTGFQHELLQEKDDIRQRFWAAFDAYLGVHGAAAAGA